MGEGKGKGEVDGGVKERLNGLEGFWIGGRFFSVVFWMILWEKRIDMCDRLPAAELKREWSSSLSAIVLRRRLRRGGGWRLWFMDADSSLLEVGSL